MNSEIRLVGTAHVSAKSVEDVKKAIEEFNPEIIAVELDPPRFAALKKQTPDVKIADVLRAGNFTQLLVQWLLAYVQRRVGMDVGVEPGAEMKAALEEAEKRKIPVALIDRDIRITLSRFWRSMTVMEKLRLIWALLISVISPGKTDINVEELMRQDVVTAALQEFRKFSPNGARALIDERDAYLAHQMLMLGRSHAKVLAVVGAGHIPGVQQYFANPVTLPPQESLTTEVKSPPWAMIFEIFVILSFALLLLAILFSGVGFDVLITAVLYWVLIHGVLTAVFTLAAGGHPLSALTGFAVSWFTALHPLLAAGWFSAIVEAKIRNPSTKDFRGIMEAGSFAELRKNPLFRVILVAALANVGSTLGTVIYFLFIFNGLDMGTVIATGFGNMWHAFSAVFGI